jgi:hypothetical protein
MINAADYAEISTEDARDLLDSLALNFYYSDRWKTEFAGQWGVEVRTVQAWYQGERKPPYWAIAVLDSEGRARSYKGILSNLNLALEGLRKVAEKEL